MPTTAERESARLAWRIGIGRGDPPEPEPEPEAPTAPVLSVVEPVSDPPSFTAVIDDTVGENDSYWLQMQADGGDWSTLLVDDTDTITSGEDAANQIDATVSALGAGSYDARMAVRDGSGPWSSWSNVVDVVIEEAGDPPVPTRLWQVGTGGGQTPAAAAQNFGTVPEGGLSVYLMVFCVADWMTISSASITPDGGAPIAGTVVVQFSSADVGIPNVGLVRFAIPEGTTGMGNAVAAVAYSSHPFNGTEFAAWSVPTANLSSQTEVDTASGTVSPGTAPTLEIVTAADGFAIFGAASADLTSNSCTWTGDSTPSEWFDTPASAMQFTAADASGTSADATSGATATYVNSAKARVVAASFR